MSDSTTPKRRLWSPIVRLAGWSYARIGLVLFIAAVAALVFAQVVASLQYQDRLENVFRELRQLEQTKIGDEKLRQEALKLRIENEQKAVFWQALLVTLTASIGVVAALSGMWAAFSQYLASRERERLDRAGRDMEQLWEGIAQSNDSQKQAASIAALHQFLTPEKREFHGRVAAALALAGRMANRNTVVTQTLLPVIERAMTEMTQTMGGVSWQGLSVPLANLRGLDLSGFDFRDSNLSGADFRGCTLSNTRFDNAKLVRSKFDDADLSSANLEYADLADATFVRTRLIGANLRHIKVMNLDLEGADLTGASLSMHDTDFRLIRNWRTAQFPVESVKERLIRRIGPPVHGPRVLMLMWEFIPRVSGGAWTAAWHLLRNLRRAGADLTVMVPWSSAAVSLLEFGNEIRLMPLGDENTTAGLTYTTYSEARTRDFSSYAATGDTHSAYVKTFRALPKAVEGFAQAAANMAEQSQLKFDVVHAHDWLAFPAALAIVQERGTPWVAHFHSTERDRQQEDASVVIEQIERRACRSATQIVVPSRFTRDCLHAYYGVDRDKVMVVPNCLSDEEIVDNISAANRAHRKVVFSGRLATQKGPDRFVDIAREVKASARGVEFYAYGDGPLMPLLKDRARGTRTLEMPTPQAVDASAPNSVERIAARVEIESIAPVDYDIGRHVILRRHAVPETRRAALLKELVLKQGFIAYATGDDKTTHVIEVRGLSETAPRFFAVNARGLLGRDISAGPRAAAFEGGLEWTERKRAFEGASLVVVPSRAEPFGMVVLEAMQAGIPVLYDAGVGCAEVLSTGIRIDATDTKSCAGRIAGLLQDEARWLECAEAQLAEIRDYPKRAYEAELSSLWGRLCAGATA